MLIVNYAPVQPPQKKSSHKNHHTHNNKMKVHSSTSTHWTRKDWNNWQSKTCMKRRHIIALHRVSLNGRRLIKNTFGRTWTNVIADCCHHHSNILCEELRNRMTEKLVNLPGLWTDKSWGLKNTTNNAAELNVSTLVTLFGPFTFKINYKYHLKLLI